ncbi:MAG: carbohydrate kinase [Dictyoglomus sp.]|nr:carbohydrate kinase [Dictyoglomus sp.]MCX7942837.1 carbohydrate kinase [Dictyoglomaceae bacterium]MDW8188355.1 carbohydrate kinase [Dictyoglomus sp.]
MILVSGEALIDFTPTKIDDKNAFIISPGGSPYNVAITLGRLKADVSFFGKISEDIFGEILVSFLKENNVDLRYLVRGKEPTTLAFIVIGPNNEPNFVFYGDNTADSSLKLEDLPSFSPSEIDLIHFGSISLIRGSTAFTLEKLMEREKERILISLDPNVRPMLISNKQEYIKKLEKWISCSDLVKVSKGDLNWLYPENSIEDIAKNWLNLGPTLVIVTKGDKGAIAFSKEESVEVPALEINVVDTVGAGDSFMGGFLYWLWKNKKLQKNRFKDLSLSEIKEGLKFATKVAGITCTRIGANPPFLEELN